MSFLGQLADQVSSQFSLGENSNTSLNAVINGQNVQYGALGDFANQIDKSAERRYVEEGYLRVDPYTTKSKQFDVLFQEPDATVLVKKRMFSSVAENFRPDFMDKDETLYYRATKILFQNKCRQIAALEKLSKIQKVTSAIGNINDQLVPVIITLTDGLVGSNGSFNNNLFQGAGPTNPATTTDAGKFVQVVDQLRKLYAYSHSSQFTNWITDTSNMFVSQIGAGTGVIEITNFTEFSTTTTVSLSNPGRFNMTIADPYLATVISEYDIEIALSDATNAFYNTKTYQLGLDSADQVINDKQNTLNQLRSTRGASNISFKIDPGTLFGKRVTAIIDAIGLEIPFTYDSSGGTGFPGLGGFTGNGVNVPADYLQGGSVAGQQGLSTTGSPTLPANPSIKSLVHQSELTAFQALVTAIFSKINIQAGAQNAFQTTNQNTNYARRKMRSNFSGQPIIQPMDIVHIYVNSKSRYDNKLLTGMNNMFSGAGILQNLNNTITGVTSTFNSVSAMFGGSGGAAYAAEKAVYVGSTFPNFLWSLLRTNFVTEQEGTHVFAGLVDNAADDWADGRYHLAISGNDNTAYFEMGKVNFKPGADVFNGNIFDPLTPFKSKFDAITSNAKDKTPELLDENKAMLTASQDSSLVRFKLGPLAGQRATQANIIQDHIVDLTSNTFNKVFYAPDGLVYKWKEGIGVFTYGGSSLELNDPNKVGVPNTYVEPFAGQDVMNVISLLITGVPYNFSTYFKSAQNFGGPNTDPQTLQSASYSFVNSLRNDLKKNNSLWGNFIPFKNLVVGEQTYSKIVSNQLNATQNNDDINSKLKQLADLNNQAMLAGAANVLGNNSSTSNPNLPNIQAQATDLINNLNQLIRQVATQQSSSISGGPDTSYDNLTGLDPGDPQKSISDASIRKYLRKQINLLTRRMSYDVRGNTDKNLFIVDDTYDKDYDIAAYNQEFNNNMKLYNNDFNSVKQSIESTAQLLDLEVFCDTQGHIRVRPPQYNRMPSSVFYHMMYLKQTLNIQVFPQFMSDFFLDQLNTLKSRIEIIEDQIRLDCALLNLYTSLSSDQQATQFLQNSTVTSGTGDSFSFLSIPTSGSIVDIGILLSQANPESINAGSSSGNTFSNVQQQASSTKNTFTNSQAYIATVQVLGQQVLANTSGQNVNNTTASTISNPVVDTLISRIQTKSGQKLSVQDYVAHNDAGIAGISVPSNQQVDVFKITQQLTDLTSQRQKIVKLFYQSLKNTAEFQSLDSASAGQTANALMLPGVYGNNQIPEVYEHMIEDESYDDYGPNSGSRFVIRRSQIRRIEVRVTAPEHTAVEVKGVLIPQAPTALPTGLDAFPNNGNGLTTAMAIDYDMWRNYGYKQPQIVDAPFLSDPQSQCGPYAAILLSRNRKNILRGSLTISGNEYMQPGEVIYLEDRGLLFYVNSVQHQFTYASGFTTTLNLSYGHTPGDYIPTVMDAIGKLIYANKDSASISVQRQESSSNDISGGALISDPNPKNPQPLNTGDPNVATTSISAFNTQTVSNILFTVAYLLNANNTQGNNTTAKVELRAYYDDSTGAVNSNLDTFRTAVAHALNTGGKNGGPQNKQIAAAGGAANNTPIPFSLISSANVNLSSNTETRSPSQKAYDAARKLLGQNATGLPSTTNNLTGDQIKKSLFNNIVDVWITISNNDGS